MKLEEIRLEIDKIDEIIVDAFEKRMGLSVLVAEDKKKTGKKILDKDRENEKLNKVKKMVHNEFNMQGVEELFGQIMAISRKLQYKVLSSKEEINFCNLESLTITDKTKVVFFGATGTYTQHAMEDYFGNQIKSYNKQTFKEVMEEVNLGYADYGILPIENSSTGGIADIYDLIIEFDNYIIGEHILKIDHALIGLEGSTIENIQKVYSHPQALMQCSKFLDQYNHIKRFEYFSTADSAKKIAKDKDQTQAAIASKRAAQNYGLKILKEEINSNTLNATRFIVISNQKSFLKTASKISICFELPHQSGTLYNMLSHFIFNNLNLTKIESRPIEGKNWEYRFFIDVEGNLNSPSVKNALQGIMEEANYFKVLGNF